MSVPPGLEAREPPGYLELLTRLKESVTTARLRANRVVNTELITLYWDLGAAIVERQDVEGWGASVTDRLARDLRAAFPDMKGLSRSNLYAMRKLARAWPRAVIVQQAVGQLPWGHVTILLDKLDTLAERDFYAAAAVEHGWSRNVLAHHIATSLHTRIGAAPSNFTDQLPAPDSDLARQLVRDPYVFDFLTLTGRAAERDLEDALMGRLQRFLLELGNGFAFVGRQHHFTVNGQDFFIDLLFFNYTQSRFVIIELNVVIEAVGMEAHGTGPQYAYDQLKQQLRPQSDRPAALREAIYACRKGGNLFIRGVFGGFVDKFPLGAMMNKALTVRGAQQHGQRYIPGSCSTSPMASSVPSTWPPT